MSKNFTLLSIGAALLVSLCYIEVGHAIQVDWTKLHRVQTVTIKQIVAPAEKTAAPAEKNSNASVRVNR